MERNEQDRILALAEESGVQLEWTDPGDGTGWLEFCGTLEGFVSFTEAYTQASWGSQDVYYALVKAGLSEDLVEGETEFTGNPDSFWAFAGSLKRTLES